MGADIAFSAQLTLDVAEAVKKIEGSLPRVGIAYQKELEAKTTTITQNVTKGLSGGIQRLAGVGISAMSGAMNPQMTAQELEAQMMPKLMSALFNALPMGVGEAAGALEEAKSSMGYMQQNYVHTGAKEATMGAIEQMTARGFAPSDQQVDAIYKAYDAQRQSMWNARQRAVGRIESAAQEKWGEGVTGPGGAIGKALSTAAGDIKALLVGLSEAFGDLLDPDEEMDVDKTFKTLFSRFDVANNPTKMES